jgi:hypothetical protein
MYLEQQKVGPERRARKSKPEGTNPEHFVGGENEDGDFEFINSYSSPIRDSNFEAQVEPDPRKRMIWETEQLHRPVQLTDQDKIDWNEAVKRDQARILAGEEGERDARKNKSNPPKPALPTPLITTVDTSLL